MTSRPLSLATVATLPLLAVIALVWAMAAGQGTAVTGPPEASNVVQAQAIIDEQHAAIVSGLTCTGDAAQALASGLVDTVVVRGAKTDTAVVWTLDLDAALTAAQAGEVWVLDYCSAA